MSYEIYKFNQPSKDWFIGVHRINEEEMVITPLCKDVPRVIEHFSEDNLDVISQLTNVSLFEDLIMKFETLETVKETHPEYFL
jgi:hypothetical protein